MGKSYHFIKAPVIRHAYSQADAQGMLDHALSTHLPAYNNAIFALLNGSDDLQISSSIVNELKTIDAYFRSLLQLTFKYPIIRSYRPLLILCCNEIGKSLLNNARRWYLLSKYPQISRNFVRHGNSTYEDHLADKIDKVIDACNGLRLGSVADAGLIDLFSHADYYKDQHQLEILIDYYYQAESIIDEVQKIKSECIDYGVESPTLSYIQEFLDTYQYMCRPDFVKGIISTRSYDEYVGFVQVDVQNIRLQSPYGDLTISSTIDDTGPMVKPYIRSTTSSVDINYGSKPGNVQSDAISTIEDQDAIQTYLGIDPLTKQISSYGRCKDDYQILALLGEEIDMPVINVMINSEFLSILYQNPDLRFDNDEIESVFDSPDMVYRIKAYHDQDMGYVVAIYNPLDEIISEFVFTSSEIDQINNKS